MISILSCSSICNGQVIAWYPDTATAAQAAADQDKVIFLHFGTDGCRQCEALNTYVFSDPTVQRAFDADLIAVKVDAEVHIDLVKEFGVKSLPTDVAISPDGQILLSRPSPTIAASYLKMISDIKTTRSKLEDPDAHIENAAYQIQQAAQKQAGMKAQTASFAHPFPYQDPVQPEATSMEVKRQARVIKNPFVQGSEASPEDAPSTMTAKQGQFAPQPGKPAAPMGMSKPLQMPGQLSPPAQLSMPAQLKMPPQLQMAQSKTNEFVASAQATPSIVEGTLTPPNQSAAPGLQRLDQSDVAARLVREQARQKRASFSSDAKLVTEDRFYGNRTARQPENAIAGNYQAKINLPQENKEVAGFVPPQPPKFGSENTESQGTKATLASTPVSVLNYSSEAGGPIQDGLDKASATPAKPNYALHGKCPVTLLTNAKWVDGEESIGCVHRNRIYIFSSQENLKTFQSDPDGFSPILAGYDPVIFEETGRLVDGLEEFGVFMGKTPKQRIVLFASPETRARFQLEPRKYLQTIRQAMEKSGTNSMR